MKKIVEVRNKLKSKKPSFTRHDAHKKTRVGSGWRRPKGRQNKMRLHRKGYARDRSSGFGSPLLAKGLSREGFTQNIVMNIKDFTGLDAKNDGIIIARTTGNRKKAELVEYANKNGFILLNLDVDQFKKSLDNALAQKAEKKKELNKKRKEKDEAAVKESAKAEKKAEKKSEKKAVDLSDEEKKALEKKEHDKLLTKEN